MKLGFHNARMRVGEFTLELDLTITREVTAFFGPSGSGKTLTLELIAGLRRLDEGEITLEGVLFDSPAKRIFVPPRHRAMGYVPQDLALFPHLSVQQNLEYGRKAEIGAARRVDFDKLCRLLEIERLLDRRPDFLSGGEKQRVALARALLASPHLLLLDEPLASLDQSLKAKILPYLQRVREAFAIPLIYVSHSPEEVMTLCEDVIGLRAGQEVARGKPGEIFEPSPTQVYRLRGGS